MTRKRQTNKSQIPYDVKGKRHKKQKYLKNKWIHPCLTFTIIEQKHSSTSRGKDTQKQPNWQFMQAKTSELTYTIIYHTHIHTRARAHTHTHTHTLWRQQEMTHKRNTLAIHTRENKCMWPGLEVIKLFYVQLNWAWNLSCSLMLKCQQLLAF